MAGFGRRDIKGVICPLATPLRNGGGFDEAGAERLVKHVIGTGDEPLVDAVFANGLTGEFPWTGIETQREMLKSALAAAGGRVPVLQGVSARTLGQAQRNCEYARKAGADGIVVAPFFFHGSSRGMPSLVREVAGAFGGPVYLYLNRDIARMGPRGRERELRTHIFKRMLLETENLWGMKYSSADSGRFENYRRAARHKPGARVFMGDEDKLLQSYAGEGWVPSFANIDPMLCGSVYDPCDSEGRLMAVQRYIVSAGDTVYCGGRKTRAGLKYALGFMGVCGDACLEPGEPLTEPEKLGIRRLVREMGKSYSRASGGRGP